MFKCKNSIAHHYILNQIFQLGMFAGGLSSMIGDGNGIQDDDTEANAGMILNFLGNQVSMNINDSMQPKNNIGILY